MSMDCVPGGIRTLTNGFGGRYAIHCATGTRRNNFTTGDLNQSPRACFFSEPLRNQGSTFSTPIVKFAARAAIAPTAAQTGIKIAPTTPIVNGISI